MIKKIAFLFCLLSFVAFSQEEDLLKDLDSTVVNVGVTSAFKSLKIVNLESTKLAAKGDLYFVVAHRFGYLNKGFEDFFGLDNADTRLQLVYGLTNGVSLQASRSAFRQTVDFGVKYRLVSQETNGFPFEIVGFNSIAINNSLKKSDYPKMEFSDKLTYVNQLLVSRKFNDKLSLEIAPSHFHENFVYTNEQNNSQFALGMGGRYKLTKRWSINLDYAAHLNRDKSSLYKNPLSVGFDLETGGHVFQMHFTNSQAMHESGYLGNTTGSWNKSQIAFGFNMVRVF